METLFFFLLFLSFFLSLSFLFLLFFSSLLFLSSLGLSLLAFSLSLPPSMVLHCTSTRHKDFAHTKVADQQKIVRNWSGHKVVCAKTSCLVLVRVLVLAFPIHSASLSPCRRERWPPSFIQSECHSRDALLHTPLSMNFPKIAYLRRCLERKFSIWSHRYYGLVGCE